MAADNAGFESRFQSARLVRHARVKSFSNLNREPLKFNEGFCLFCLRGVGSRRRAIRMVAASQPRDQARHLHHRRYQ